MSKIIDTSFLPARRNFLGAAGVVTLSATAIAILGGCESMESTPAQAAPAAAGQDVSILNVALGLEHEGIAAYQLGAQSGLLQKPVLDIALKFQADHKGHRDVLVSTIQKLGGTPVEAKPLGDYAKALKADTLKNQTDVLTLARRLELGAANAYLGVIPALKDPQLAKVSARLAADETMHWTILNNALGGPLPADALPFGA